MSLGPWCSGTEWVMPTMLSHWANSQHFRTSQFQYHYHQLSTSMPSQQSYGCHITTTAPTPVMAPGNTTLVMLKGPNLTKLHAALGSTNLVKSTVMMIPKLTGNENYINWSDQVVATFHYCGIEKILLGEWEIPKVVTSDPNSKKEANKTPWVYCRQIA